jgi:hypothetical protein
VTDPVESLMLLRDGEMLLRDAHGSRSIDLSSHPMVQIFIDGITLLLAGDLDGLQAHYRMRFEAGDGDPSRGWSLHLEPTVSPLDSVITSISFAGRGQRLDSLIVIETSGDETRTRFSDVDAERRFSNEEIERLFPSRLTSPGNHTDPSASSPPPRSPGRGESPTPDPSPAP